MIIFEKWICLTETCAKSELQNLQDTVEQCDPLYFIPLLQCTFQLGTNSLTVIEEFIENREGHF